MPSKDQTQNKDKRPTKGKPQSASQSIDPLYQQEMPSAILFQRARHDSGFLLTPRDVLQLQRTIGNQAISRLLAGSAVSGQPFIQRAAEGAIQRNDGDVKLAENDVGSVSSGHRIEYTPLSAGCLAVTAFYDGGGCGVHLPMMFEAGDKWAELEGELAGRGIKELHVDVDEFGGEGWRVMVRSGVVDTSERPRSTTYLVWEKNLKMQPDKRIFEGKGEWRSDELYLKMWFHKRLGFVPKVHMRGAGGIVPPYVVP